MTVLGYFIMRFIEFLHKHGRQIIRFLFILLLSLLVNIFLIPDRQIPENLPRITEENVTYIDLNPLNITQSVQDSINSGNLNELIWDKIYFGYGRDRFCFKIINYSDDTNVSVSYNLNNFKEIKSKKCFDIPQDSDKITFNLKYNFKFTLSKINPQKIVNESDCIPGTIDEVHGTCITNESIKNAKTEIVFFPEIKTYFEANGFHKFIKFLWVFLLTGIVYWNITRVYVFIRDGLSKPRRQNQ